MRSAYACPEWLSEAILRQATESGDPLSTAKTHGITLSQLMALCGDSADGHRWVSDDIGADGTYRRSIPLCAVCYAPDDRDYGGDDL